MILLIHISQAKGTFGPPDASGLHQPHPAWPTVRNDGSCIQPYLEGQRFPIPDATNHVEVKCQPFPLGHPLAFCIRTGYNTVMYFLIKNLRWACLLRIPQHTWEPSQSLWLLQLG